MFIGIDWASKAHELCVLDADGIVVDRFAFAHTERGISKALQRPSKLASAGELPVAIERPDGLLVDRLLEAGHDVVPIHANAFHAARPRWKGAASKSVVGDAYRLADLLRTDRQRLRPLRPLDQATRELQALVRLRDDHVQAKVAVTNQLAALLDQHWPGAAAIFGRLDSEIALDFLNRYPTPQSAARLREIRLASFLRRHSYCGRRSPSELLSRLRDAHNPSTSSTPKPSPSSSAHKQPCCAPCSRRSPTSTARSRPASINTAGPNSSNRCRASARSASANSSPKSDRCSTAPPTPSKPPRSAAPAQSPNLSTPRP